jgi:hypothetical protein
LINNAFFRPNLKLKKNLNFSGVDNFGSPIPAGRVLPCSLRSKGRCSPSSPCSPVKNGLRVAPGGSAPAASAALLTYATRGSGIEGVGTGNVVFRLVAFGASRTRNMGSGKGRGFNPNGQSWWRGKRSVTSGRMAKEAKSRGSTQTAVPLERRRSAMKGSALPRKSPFQTSLPVGTTKAA